MPYVTMATNLPYQLSEFLSMVSRFQIMQILGKNELVSTFLRFPLQTCKENKTSSPMGNDLSPGSLHNTWRYYNL